MKVGFIGLGHMGRPMASNVLRAGFDLTVYNRTRSKAAELEARGAKLADSPAELTRNVDIVLTCLADIASTAKAFLGEGGVIQSARRGQILADHATVDPETSREIHREAMRKGVPFLDAPISGGPDGAESATLAIMVGGESAAFGRALPVFRAMGRTIVHMGPSGAGTATKLANQLLVGVHTLASCEALVLARKAGVDLGRLVEVLEYSWGASRMLTRNAPNLIRENFGPSASPLRHIKKDLSIVTALARESGLSLPAASEAERVFATLLDMGRGDWDITAAALLLGNGSDTGNSTGDTGGAP